MTKDLKGDNSKKLSEKKREQAREIIIDKCLYGIGFATHKEIDELNILNATFLAMQRAYEKFLKASASIDFNLPCTHIIVDGNLLPHFLKDFNQTNLFDLDNALPKASTLIKGDDKIPAIMAASILAKTERDKIMRLADKKWPQYGFTSHKGYGTKYHTTAINKFSPCPIARKTFSIGKN